MMVVVCQNCRSSNQFGTLFCRNCGEKLKIVDQNHPDFKASATLKKIFVKIIKLVIVLGVIALLGALFVPFGLPVEKELSSEDIKIAKENCDAIDSALATGKDSIVFTFTPGQAAWGMNYLLDEKRPMPADPTVSSSAATPSASVSAPASMTSSPPASLNTKLSDSGGLKSRSSGPIKLSSSAPSARPSAPAQATAPAAAAPEAGVWKGNSLQGQKAEVATAPADPAMTCKYALTINKDRGISIILTGKMLYWIPYRMELAGELKDSEPDKAGNTKPSFTLKTTKFGHITFPSFLKNQGIELFKLLVSSKKIKAYSDRIDAINVESEDAIKVTVSR